MPKHPTFPTLYNDVLNINITNLKKWGYLIPHQEKTGIINWSIRGEIISTLSIKSNTKNYDSYIEISYKCNNESRNYKIQLKTINSNLNKGKINYFLCPKTNKLCRKLYLVNGLFLHREAFKGCMYESQIQSKKYRLLNKTFSTYFKSEKLYEELYSKHFKKTYSGKPTKRYLKITSQIKQAKSIPQNRLEMALLS